MNFFPESHQMSNSADDKEPNQMSNASDDK